MKKLSLFAVAALAVAGAHAQIVSTVGGSEITAPADVQLNVLEGTEGVAFTEQDLIKVQELSVDHDGSAGVFNDNTDLTAITLSGSYSVYFMHMDALGNGPQDYDFTVEFAQEIKGVILNDATLDATDAVLGNAGTIYPTGLTNRGWEDTGPDGFEIQISGNTLRYTGRVTSPLDSVRVLTNPVPEPTTMAALGLGALALLRRKRNK
ncbi:MAG: PEP-CTERM sorting domain-containing protein [Fimbriimonadaceae bacterium]